MQHPHLRDFPHRELIWTIDFKFGAHKWKHHTYLQLECKILSTKKNSAVMQIASSHVGSCEKMKEGNYSIHVGIVIGNFPSFEYWTQIDLLCFKVSCFFKVPLSCTTLNFSIVWVFFLNCWFAGIISFLAQKTWQIICCINRGHGIQKEAFW